MRCLVALRRIPNVCFYDHVQKNRLNFVPVRSIRANEKVKWVAPVKVPSYHPSKTGDLSLFQMPNENDVLFYFKDKLKNVNEEAMKVFKMGNQSRYCNFDIYKKEMIDKVRAHNFDESSVEVKLAQLTAQIRIYWYLSQLKTSNGKLRITLHKLVNKRRKYLSQLRETDYKKFEWLLEQLDLKYIADPISNENLGRKKAVKLLAELQKEKMKEAKLAEYKKMLDQQKIPFLKHKIEKLRSIQETEAALQLESTVSDSDIEEVIKKIEKVKLDIQKAEKIGYKRKVHPYTLEVYYPQKKFGHSD